MPKYRYIPTIRLAIPADVIDPAVRYEASVAYYAASARCANKAPYLRRDAVEGLGACLIPGALRVRDEI